MSHYEYQRCGATNPTPIATTLVGIDVESSLILVVTVGSNKGLSKGGLTRTHATHISVIMSSACGSVKITA